MKKHLSCIQILISLIILNLLLILSGLPVYAGETVLNTSLSVTVPDQQNGNPGDFLTYVLSFQNRGDSPLDLQVEYITDPDWNIIGDALITVPANSKNFFFPVTAIIPINAQANIVKKIQIGFKIYGEAFNLPMVSIPVLVNPVSTINFGTPSPQSGLNGSTVNYSLVVTNNGNTVEYFSVKGTSENEWPLEIGPSSFQLNPEQSQAVIIEHQIPGYSETEYDQVKLEFSWGNEQKIILLTTNITDKFDKMADRYYIWQGQLSASHPDITEPGLTDPNLSFSMNGHWKPDSAYQLYISDLLNDLNRRYYTHFKSDGWDVKAGDFSLPWEGMIAPKSSLGNLRVAHNTGERSYGFYAWDNLEGDSSKRPFGLELFLNDNSRFSLLNDYLNDSEQTVFEWDYQTNLRSGLKWSNSLAYNASDSDGYAFGIGIDRYYGNWYFTSRAQTFKEISDYLDKKRLHLTLYQPLSNEKMTIYNQFMYEARTLEDAGSDLASEITDYDDYYIETIFNWPFGLNIRFSYQYQLANGSFSKHNTSFFVEDVFEKGRYQHEWWLNHSIDSSASDANSNYTKLNWETEYALSKNEDLLFNPQIVSNSASSENESKLGFGFQQRLYHNSLEWKSLLYRYFTSEPKHSLEFSLDWRIYQYQLALQYVGIWNSDYSADSLNFVVRKKFSIPIQKPLGAVEGVAFLDRNQNGQLDDDETPLRKMILVLDGSINFETDQNGRFAIYGLAPGEHQISLDPLYEVIYLPETPVTTVTVKQYQTTQLDLPFIRSQNITGKIYFDRNINGEQDPGEPDLSGIPIDLINKDQKKESRAYSNHNGQFIFYQVAPGLYRFSLDDNLLPDNMQAPTNLETIAIDSGNLEESSLIKIGLFPFERPINIVKEEAKLLLTISQELIKPGAILELTIESSLPLQRLELILPTGETVRLETLSNTVWNYRWRVPQQIPSSQVKIKCSGIDLKGKTHLEEALLVIIP